jgi:YD repeat-containing protein
MSPASVDINPGLVSNVLATALPSNMNGMVVWNGAAYVAVPGAILKVVISSGAVSTYAGNPSDPGCYPAAKLTMPAQIATDGVNLYVADEGCTGDIMSVNLSGPPVISRLAHLGGFAHAVTMGASNFLYASTQDNNVGGVYRIDTSTQQPTRLIPMAGNVSVSALSADSHIWVTEVTGSQKRRLDRYDLDGTADGAWRGPSGADVAGAGQMLVSGSYLYVTTPSNNGIERITEPTNPALPEVSPLAIAGTPSAGWRNGTGTDAWFSGVAGLGTDGTNLFATDSVNHYVRKIVSGIILPSTLSANATASVDIYPGRVQVLTSDSPLSRGITGAVIVNVGGVDTTFLTVPGAVVKLDPATGHIVTMAGVPGTYGCVQSTDAAQVRFSAGIGQIDSDGYYLYVSDGGDGTNNCHDILRVSIATGATSLLTEKSHWANGAIGPITYGSDGNLYACYGGNTSRGIYKIDRLTGSTSPFGQAWASLGGDCTGIASDGGRVWVSWLVNGNNTELDGLDIVNPANNKVSYAPPTGGSMTGHGQLASAGDYLYTASVGETGVERVDKTTGAVGILAGGKAGHAGGEWSDAQFGAVTGVATDGQSLRVADSSNHELDRVDFVPLLAQELGGDGSADASTANAVEGDPVDTNPASGAFLWSGTDASLPVPGIMPFAFTRYYSTRSAHVGRFGLGWSDSFDASLVLQPRRGSSAINVTMPTGQVIQFAYDPIGQVWRPNPGVFDTLTYANPDYQLVQPDGTTFDFAQAPNSGDLWRLATITDRDKNVQTLTYNADGGSLARVDTSNARMQETSRNMTFTYNSDKMLSSVTLDDGRIVSYGYYLEDGLHHYLHVVTDLRGRQWTFWEPGTILTEISNDLLQAVVTNTFDDKNRVYQQWDGTSGPTKYTYYDYGPSNCADQTTIYCTKVQNALGFPWEYDYDSGGTGVLTRTRDPEGNAVIYDQFDSNVQKPKRVTVVRAGGSDVWAYTYVQPGNQGVGNVATESLPAGNQQTYTITYSYGPFAEVVSRMDERGGTTRWGYDADGNLVCEIPPNDSSPCDPLDGNQTYYTYLPNTNGSIQSITSPSNGASSPDATSFDYFGDGVVKTVTRPSPDSDQPHSVTTYSDLVYDAGTGLITQTMVTPQGNAIPCSGQGCAQYTWTYIYDAAGNRLSVQDPLGNHVETSTYDGAGRLFKAQDGNQYNTSKLTTYDYLDGSSRVKDVVSPYGSGSLATTTYKYDAAGQLNCTILPTAANPAACESDPTHTIT